MNKSFTGQVSESGFLNPLAVACKWPADVTHARASSFVVFVVFGDPLCSI